MTAIDIIYKRRAVRSYKKQHISNGIINKLLNAAVRAPTAMHQEAWAFAIIQDKNLLKKISDHIKKNLAKERQNSSNVLSDKSFDYFVSEEFNIFYNAATLIIIYGETDKPFIDADCWLAAENLMLAACEMGLGSCVVGLAVKTLNSDELKKELKIPPGLTAFAPIILGYPNNEVPVASRKKPKIIFRK